MASDQDIVARHIGARIRELRESKGMSPSTLADHLDIEVADIRRFELGEERIAPNLLVSMARLWDVGIEWFFRDAPASGRAAPSTDEELAARFMALTEAQLLMRAFVSIPHREGRVTVVNFARLLASPAG